MVPRKPAPSAMVHQSSTRPKGWTPASAATSGAAAPPSRKSRATASGSVILSQGRKSLTRSGRTKRTASQKVRPPGSKGSGPQVVTARRPPGRTRRQSLATWASMSGTKKIAKTQTTASKLASAKPRSVMSPVRKAAFRSPSSSAFPRARSSMASARSTPITRPSGPTARAAGSAEAPVPQPTSSTRAPGARARRSIVRLPMRSQKDSGGASK